MTARSVDFKLSGVKDFGAASPFAVRWEGTLEVVVDGRTAFAELWNPAEFALVLGLWLAHPDSEFQYNSVDADRPALWLRHEAGTWVIGSDLPDDPIVIARIGGVGAFKKAAIGYWDSAKEQFPALESELDRIRKPS